MEKGKTEEKIIDIKLLFHELLTKIWAIIIVSLIFGAVALFASLYLIKPQYVSSTSVYVFNRSGGGNVTYSDLQTSSSLLNDYEALVKSRFVMESAISALKLSYTPEELGKLISISAKADTRILTIEVRNENPYLAQQIADKIRQAAAGQISEVVNADAVNLVDEANYPTIPESPNVKRNTVIGLLVGFVLSSLLVAVIFLRRQRVEGDKLDDESDDDFEKSEEVFD